MEPDLMPLAFTSPSSPPPIEFDNALDLSDEEDFPTVPADDCFDITGLSQKLKSNKLDNVIQNSTDDSYYINSGTSKHNIYNEISLTDEKGVEKQTVINNETNIKVLSEGIGKNNVTIYNEELINQEKSISLSVVKEFCHTDDNVESSLDISHEFQNISGSEQCSEGHINSVTNINRSDSIISEEKINIETNDEDFGEFFCQPYKVSVNTPDNVVHKATEENISTQSSNEDISNSSNEKENYLNKILTCHQSIKETIVDESNFEDFSEFHSSKVIDSNLHSLDNDFGDESENGNSDLENEIRKKIDLAINDDDDEFGDFSSSSFQEKTIIQDIDSNNSTSTNIFPAEIISNPDVKFDSLILQWVPFEPCFKENEEETKIDTLEEAVEGDMFIWHHLQDVDSSLALKIAWASAFANKLFSISLKVDARNIMFRTKWSSSVPVFAQTLRFSPLTPVKPAKNFGINNSEMEETVQFNSTSNKTTGNQPSKEKIIPPVKFDWSSSGLTNPLDVRGFDKESCSVGGKRTIKNTSSLIKQILEKKKNSTSLEFKTEEGKSIIQELPDLSFMKSKVLMFPVRGKV